MTSSLHSPPQLVQGAAHDPHLARADGTQCSLRFFSDFPSAKRVLDVGCGNGTHLRDLTAQGCDVVGVERDPQSVKRLERQGFRVVQGVAENLPFADASFDAIVCSVVVPYTDERRAVAEWARVLAPHGEVRASFHGIAYALHYLLRGPDLRRRLYGGRMIANSCVYRLTGHRLPRFWGDTLYQSAARLHRYYAQTSLALLSEYVRPGVGGLREIFFHHLQKC
jgi:SAM-dependent methyltransferase